MAHLKGKDPLFLVVAIFILPVMDDVEAQPYAHTLVITGLHLRAGLASKQLVARLRSCRAANC